MGIREIIDALRGDNVDPNKGPAVRRNADGSIVKHPGVRGSSSYNPDGTPKMVTGLRGYQLHNQEAAAEGTPRATYADWVKDYK